MLKRSSDQGRTWSAEQVIVDDTGARAEHGVVGVLDWVVDWGLWVTNAAEPLGARRACSICSVASGTFRASPESLTAYRQRIAAIADVVTPNAVKRRLNKV